jgi:hypothetical protein
MSNWVCAEMHVVGYLRVMRVGKGDDKKTIRRLQTQTMPPFFGKDRYHCLGEYSPTGEILKPWLQNPTLASITERIEGSGGESKPPARRTTTPAARPARRRRPAATK